MKRCQLRIISERNHNPAVRGVHDPQPRPPELVDIDRSTELEDDDEMRLDSKRTFALEMAHREITGTIPDMTTVFTKIAAPPRAGAAARRPACAGINRLTKPKETEAARAGT